MGAVVDMVGALHAAGQRAARRLGGQRRDGRAGQRHAVDVEDQQQLGLGPRHDLVQRRGVRAAGEHLAQLEIGRRERFQHLTLRGHDLGGDVVHVDRSDQAAAHRHT